MCRLIASCSTFPSTIPTFIHAGQDNGTQPGDDGESDLDVEISGGIAPNAQVYFVIGTPTFLVDGITNSIEYIVENNLADIMSISYGSAKPWKALAEMHSTTRRSSRRPRRASACSLPRAITARPVATIKTIRWQF